MNIAIITIITSLLTTIFTQYILRKNFNDNLKENYRKKYFESQFEAYLNFWSTLRPLSQYYSKKTILEIKDDKIFLNKERSLFYIEDMTDFFFSQYGIFLTRRTRNLIFDFRRDLLKQINLYKGNENLIALTFEQKKELRKHCQKILETTRMDIGLLNLKFDITEFKIDNSK
ncbi:hypothetical protein Flavo103_40260 [Flavobacterium collinsii]|uniref:hypothetical protein n=1 Tax=Flavobacterium collinsii TaxID=1114861 RepID=UPI0022CC1524|nr:hypothetical protein [Flavobacterium collinsii]GIQ60890.1 hypothetical protein Flavo103_40260 [Flavobacterium collinsii]